MDLPLGQARGRFDVNEVHMTLIVAIVQLCLLLLPSPLWAQSRGHLGVFIQNASRFADASGVRTREGVVVLGLMRNSPAEQGGMQRGDVIVRFNGQVVHQVEDLQRLVSETPLGDIAEIQLVRGDRTLAIPVKIEPVPVSMPITGPSDIVSLLLQRSGVIWISLTGVAISLIIASLSSGVLRRRRQHSPTRSGLRQRMRVRVPRHKLILAAVCVMAVIVVWTSLRVIEAGHRGVVFHLIKGVRGEVRGEGIHFLLPGLNRLTIYDVRSRVYNVRSREEPSSHSSAELQDLLLWTPTADGLKVGLDLSVRYRLDPTRLPDLHRSVGPEFEEKIVHPIVWNVTRLVASEYSLLDVYGKQRHEIQQQVFDRLQTMFARDGLICETLLLRDVVYTKEFEKTLVAKMVAEQKVQEAAFEVAQAELQAQAQVVEAHGEAQALDLVNRVIRDQPLLLRYLWITSLPEKLKIIVVPNQTGKSFPWIKPAPSEGQRTHSAPSGGD